MGEEFLPNIQPKPPLKSLNAIPLSPASSHQREIGISSSITPHEEAVGCDEVFPQPLLLQAEQVRRSHLLLMWLHHFCGPLYPL